MSFYGELSTILYWPKIRQQFVTQIAHSGQHTKNVPSHKHHDDDDDDDGSSVVEGDDGQEEKLYYPRGNKRKKMNFHNDDKSVFMADDNDDFDGISYYGDVDDGDKEDFPMMVTEMMGTKKTRKRRMMLLVDNLQEWPAQSHSPTL